MRNVQLSGLRRFTHNIQVIHTTPTQHTLFRLDTNSFIVILSLKLYRHWSLELSRKVPIYIRYTRNIEKIIITIAAPYIIHVGYNLAHHI